MNDFRASRQQLQRLLLPQLSRMGSSGCIETFCDEDPRGGVLSFSGLLSDSF
ncbi:MAG: hypothetical protein NHB15_16975 [Methanosarcina barkeri]|nr:hypothetical protein [Methanosarcina sp. ERenArc_MAG2]